jgi:AcrR family transcriptional regulator
VGRRRALETQDLVAAAARVFERRGYADATLDDIAAEAGVSKPTVYQYVSSKQRLLETIVEQAIYPLREGI